MPTINITTWDGGHAEDIRTFATNESEYSKNFDIFTNPHLLQPYPDVALETLSTGTIADFKLADVVEVDGSLYSAENLICLGEEGAADSSPKFFSKSTQSSLDSDWTPRAISSANSSIKGTLVAYKGLAYTVDSAGQVLQLTNLTTITVVNAGELLASNPICRPFVHPEDNILYIVGGNTIATWDGTDFERYTDQLPTNFTATSLTNYGGYLLIAGYILNKSVMYQWGRDGTLTTLQGTVDFGEGRLNVIENIGEVIVGAMTTSESKMVIDNKLIIKVWAGGEVTEITSIDIPSTVVAKTLKVKNKNRLFFGFATDDSIFSVGKNKNGRWAVARDRYYLNGTTIGARLDSFNIVEDIMWAGFTETTTGKFYRTKFTAGSPTGDYTATSIYKTTINPVMPLNDRYKDKQLEAIQIAYTGATSGTTVVKYSVDGSAMATVINDTNASGEKITIGTNEFTNSPALLSGKEFQFQIESTGKSQIKELRYKYTNLNEILL